MQKIEYGVNKKVSPTTVELLTRERNKGRLSFSTELLNQSEDFRRKAIVHELLHMRYPNHGKMFNLLLTSYSEKK